MVIARLPRRLLVAAAACVTLLGAGSFACNGVLGIEEAAVDPRLSSDGGDGGADAGDGDAGSRFSCAAYCDTIMQNCKAELQEYISVPVCLAICSRFDIGIAGEQTHDSLACRVYHAGEAARDPATHCKHAGPLGTPACAPDPCIPYCTLNASLCRPLSLFPYDGGESQCQTECAKFNYMADAGDLLFTAGDSLNCRLYHLQSAYEVGNPQAPLTHCPHTGTVSSTCHD